MVFKLPSSFECVISGEYVISEKSVFFALAQTGTPSASSPISLPLKCWREAMSEQAWPLLCPVAGPPTRPVSSGSRTECWVRLFQKRMREQGLNTWLREGHRHASALVEERSLPAPVSPAQQWPRAPAQAIDQGASSRPAGLGQCLEGGCIWHPLSPNLWRVLFTCQLVLCGHCRENQVLS